MIYLAVEQNYDGPTIVGASYSEEGAKALLEEYAYDDNEIAFVSIPDVWAERGRPDMQAYCRKVGRPIWHLKGQPDKQVILIAEVEE